MTITGPVRVRFAPSPTGFLHVGGARTALFNWLFAKKYGGQFLLRVEDTDQARSTEASTKAIFDGLNWLGLSWDEDVVYQGSRAAIHRLAAQVLVDANFAYPCFCTADQIEAEKQKATTEGKARMYPGTCRELGMKSKDDLIARAERMRKEPYVVRFKVPDDGATSWDDLVHGKITFPNRDIGGDFVILRTDGSPMYNFAVVYDDRDMKITHVLRGDDHISNTPKQLLIHQAFIKAGSPDGIPAFGHMPMIHGSDGQKLSKRHGATAVGDYANFGILSGAMLNFLALLGWSPGNNTEIMSLTEMTELFSVEGLSKKAAVFDTKKLEWMNGQHIQAQPSTVLALYLKQHIVNNDHTMDWWVDLADLLKTRARTMTKLVDLAQPYIVPPTEYDAKARIAHWKNPEVLLRLRKNFDTSAAWSSRLALEGTLMEVADALAIKLGVVAGALRLALMGKNESPSLTDVLTLLGRQQTISRLDAAITSLVPAENGTTT
jgi:glutamyl-tRNA synthetase